MSRGTPEQAGLPGAWLTSPGVDSVYQSGVGGSPVFAWPSGLKRPSDKEPVPTWMQAPTCASCGKGMRFLLQVNTPTDHLNEAFVRCLYFYVCQFCGSTAARRVCSFSSTDDSGPEGRDGVGPGASSQVEKVPSHQAAPQSPPEDANPDDFDAMLEGLLSGGDALVNEEELKLTSHAPAESAPARKSRFQTVLGVGQALCGGFYVLWEDAGGSRRRVGHRKKEEDAHVRELYERYQQREQGEGAKDGETKTDDSQSKKQTPSKAGASSGGGSGVQQEVGVDSDSDVSDSEEAGDEDGKETDQVVFVYDAGKNAEKRFGARTKPATSKRSDGGSTGSSTGEGALQQARYRRRVHDLLERFRGQLHKEQQVLRYQWDGVPLCYSVNARKWARRWRAEAKGTGPSSKAPSQKTRKTGESGASEPCSSQDVQSNLRCDEENTTENTSVEDKNGRSGLGEAPPMQAYESGNRPSCQQCGGSCVFEMQVLPHMAHVLHNECGVRAKASGTTRKATPLSTTDSESNEEKQQRSLEEVVELCAGVVDVYSCPNTECWLKEESDSVQCAWEHCYQQPSL